MNRDIRNLPAFLRTRVLDQEDALRAIESVVMNVECGLRDVGEAKACMMAFGPTGVGKTESFRALAEFLYGTPDAMVRFDMSEFGTDGAMPALLGDRQGDPGQLVLRLQPLEEGGGIILFDEFEKAAPAVRNLFLAILSSARVTSWAGTVVRLDNFYLCATSNVGGGRTAMADESTDALTLERNLLNEAALILSPELLGRFSVRPLFCALGDEAQRRVAALLLTREAALIKQVCTVNLIWDEEVLYRVVEWGYDRRLGARPMRDRTRILVRSAVRELLLSGSELSSSIRLSVPPNAHFKLLALPA